MVLVVIRTQEQVHLMEVVVAETGDRSIVRAVQFEVDNLSPCKAPPAVFSVLDDLRVKWQDALDSSGFPSTANTHKRKSLRSAARGRTKDHIFFYKVEPALGLGPESQIERISSYISPPHHSLETLT